ncbi:MAG: right-handed parallel beta-helix repeat-containing protein, partial [Elusimicrobia bacterium]|nr:right-handed parallel beta-helix repeat-containing protein [Elusimicrobiota bacterium]
SRPVPNLRNVTVLGISSKLRWQFVNWGGPLGGENFDDDSNERVWWDFTPPSVTLTAPANGTDFFGGDIVMSASASDDIGVTEVEFHLDDGNILGSLATPPYTLTWPWAATFNGMHIITAVARDAAGNSATSPPIQIQVYNSGTVGSVRSGFWSDGGTWSGGLVPSANNPVTISAGHTVTLNDVSAVARGVTVFGTLRAGREENSQLTLNGGDMVVNPGGWLDMGTEGSPIATGAALVLAQGSQPAQYGLRVGNGAKFTVRGANKVPYVYAVSDALANTSTIKVQFRYLQVNQPVQIPWMVGDEITVGPTQPNLVRETERRTIASIEYPSGPVGAVVIGLSQPLNYNHIVASTENTLVGDYYFPRRIAVTNLTRNVVIRSAGTDINSNTAYIENANQNPQGFAVNFGEFAFLGGNGTPYQQNGIAFVGKDAKGSISNSVIRDGYYGIVNTSVGNSFINNLICFNRYGLNLLGSRGGVFVASQNMIAGNHVYSNGVYGISVEDASNNTLTANEVYSNNVGIQVSNGSTKNTLRNNRVYSNLDSGINLDSAFENALVSNESYNNITAGLALSATINNTFVSNFYYFNNGVNSIFSNMSQDTFVEDSWGYDPSGNSLPALSNGEMRSGSPVWRYQTFKNVRINPTLMDPDYVFNVTTRNDEYILSYNQNNDLGTLRLWGNYTVSGATLALNYANPVYRTGATSPKLMRGVGHSLSVDNTVYTNAVSQLVTVRREANKWVVEGSVSGYLGEFAGPISYRPFPASLPQFYISFTEGSSPQQGDLLDFVMTGKSGDANYQKKLLFGASQPQPSKLTVASSGGLQMYGTETFPTLVDRLSAEVPFYTLIDDGALTLHHAEVRNGSQEGLQLSGSGQISIASSTFDFAGQGNAPSSCYLTLKDLSSQAVFYGLTFKNSGAVPSIYNIKVLPDDSKLGWTMIGWKGAVGGEAYNDDPNNRVIWSAPTPPTAAQPAADTQPPAVSIINPANGAVVSGGSVQISAQASDDTGVVGVQFKLDGSNLGVEVTTTPFSIVWNSTLTTNGSHTLTAIARDAAGNIATSAAVQVTVDNVVLKRPKLGRLNLMRSDGSVTTLDGHGSPRALMVSQRRGMDQQLVFGPQVKEAKITDLTGREISHVTQNGNEPLVISLQGNSGLRISTGFHLIQMRVCEENNPDDCEWQGRGLIGVK